MHSNQLFAMLVMLIVWLLVPGLGALCTLCLVTAPGSHLAQLWSMADAATRTSVADSRARWIFVAVFVVLPVITIGVVLSIGGDALLEFAVFAVFFFLWFGCTVLWFYSLWLATSLVVKPIDSAEEKIQALLETARDPETGGRIGDEEWREVVESPCRNLVNQARVLSQGWGLGVWLVSWHDMMLSLQFSRVSAV